MTSAWSPGELELFGEAEELEIATRRPDGTLRPWTPVWVVRVGGGVFVRTWHRRETGWYGHALRAPDVRVRVPGLETDVVIEDLGAGDPGRRAGVDDAYRVKYGRHGTATVDRMVGDGAAATTLRLVRETGAG